MDIDGSPAPLNRPGIQPLTGVVIYFHLKKDCRRRRLVEQIYSLGGVVLNIFDAELVTHVVTNRSALQQGTTGCPDNLLVDQQKRKTGAERGLSTPQADILGTSMQLGKHIVLVDRLRAYLTRVGGRADGGISPMQKPQTADFAALPLLPDPKHTPAAAALDKPLGRSLNVTQSGFGTCAAPHDSKEWEKSSSLTVLDTKTSTVLLSQSFSPAAGKPFPIMNFDIPVGFSPFAQDLEQLSTKKLQLDADRLKSQAKALSSAVVPNQPVVLTNSKITRSGWCECCMVKYASLDTHLQSYQHRRFAEDASNFASVDAFFGLIKSKSSNSWQ
eukprot:CAMPEP_0177628810 /NCGR_PEP_ID=MMETSP0447-20121125/330_1 /TAXON_ID=0 /ORGANISM="Stygamoeba regulata, Strain BSH-02190019" /LENGTH=328 /DNA_ID=CAMNT_0019130083 /DNA_START=131 /DNA_END=1117 /DNA_ORIENTATION=-